MQKRVIASALVAVGVHFFAFASWVTLVALDLIREQRVEATPQGDPEQTVVLNTIIETPEVVQPPEPLPVSPTETAAETAPPVAEKLQPKEEEKIKPLLKPLPKRKRKRDRRFAKTSAGQAGVPDQDTNIIGENDTRAASEMVPTPGAPEDMPSQDGSQPIHPDHVETVNQTYQDGSVGGDRSGSETEEPQYATEGGRDLTVAEVKTMPEEVAAKVEDVKVGGSAEDDANYLQQGEMIARLREKIKKENEEREAAEKKAAEKAIREAMEEDARQAIASRSKKESEKDGKGSEKEKDLKKDGFSGYTAKTRVTGSISRRGKSALNVKNSPLGRYQALVSKAVELQWRKNCEEHRDHIVPGVISLRFYVDKSGSVSGIKFQDVVGANYIERGFTQRAIRQAKLPKMPKNVLKELHGEPLELIYNFSF